MPFWRDSRLRLVAVRRGSAAILRFSTGHRLAFVLHARGSRPSDLSPTAGVEQQGGRHDMRATAAAALCALLTGCAANAVGTATLSAPAAPASPQADAKTITFDGVKYVLASVNISRATTTNEYVPEGQSLTDWTTLIGVRRFAAARELKDVLPTYLGVIKPVLVGKPEFLKRKNVDASEEVMLVALLLAPDKTYHEYNLHRFFKTADGVTAYQFAQRIPGRGGASAIDPIVKRQAERIRLLYDVTLPVHARR
jgi:hypothetical protein